MLTVVIGGYQLKKWFKRKTARDWHNDSIEILTRIIERSRNAISDEESQTGDTLSDHGKYQGEEIDHLHLLMDIEPLIEGIEIILRDDLELVEESDKRLMRGLSDMIQLYRDLVRVYENEDTGEFQEKALAMAKELIEKNDLPVDPEKTPTEAFPEEMIEEMDLQELEQKLAEIDSDKAPELAELIESEASDEFKEKGEPRDLFEVFDFPWSDYSEFGDFEDFLRPGAEYQLEKFVTVVLFKAPIEVRNRMENRRDSI